MIQTPRFGAVTHFPKMNLDALPDLKKVPNRFFAIYVQVGEDLFMVTPRKDPEGDWATVKQCKNLLDYLQDKAQKASIIKGLAQYLYHQVGLPNPLNFQMESPVVNFYIDET